MVMTSTYRAHCSKGLVHLMNAALIALAIGAAFLVLPGAACADEPAAKRREQVEQGRRTLLLTLLHTNDPHGRVYLPGKPQGLSKVATLVRQIREQMPNVLLLDAGDIIHGTPVEKASEGQAVIAAMNAMQYDAAAAGNHEFDMGQRIARQAFASANFPFLSANVVETDTGRPWDGLKAYVVREIDGIRIGIFGLTTPRTFAYQWPRTLEGISITEEVEAAAKVVKQLREQERADVVIGLTHIGHKDDLRVAEAVHGIDVILGGHTHTRLDEQVWHHGTLIMQTGAHAVTLGRADLFIEKDHNDKAIVHINGRDGNWWGHNGTAAPIEAADYSFPKRPLIPVTETIADDPAVVAAYQPYAEKVLPRLEEALTEALEPLPALDAKRREFALGQLLADAIRSHAKTDVALAPPSFNARGLIAGPISVGDIYELMGAYTRQHIVIVRVPGIRISEMVAEAFDSGEVPVHVSGFTISDDEIIVGDEPLDPDRRYTVSAPAHIIQDYFWGKRQVEVLQDDPEAPHQRDALIDYLRGHPPLRNTIEKRINRDQSAPVPVPQ